MSARSEVSRTVAADLLHCELQLLSPTVRRDRQRVSGLLARDFVEFGASGRVWSRDETLAALTGEAFEPPILEDFRCRLLAEGVVLVTYRTVRGDTGTGARQVNLRSSIWCRQAKGWVLRFHQGTRGGGAPITRDGLESA
jgi:hypothetical protein